MKPRTVMFLTFSAASVVALIGLAKAAAPDFDFLNEFAEMSSGWRKSASFLQILIFSITVFGAGIGFIQSKRIVFAKKELVTACVSFLIAILNAMLIFFFTDFRTYEKASITFDMEIQSFRALNEALDVTDPQIAQEYAHAKASLIQKLQGIRIGLTEGKLAAQFAIMPQLYAQNARVWKPADTSNFIYSIGTGFNVSDLQVAKTSAIEAADLELMKSLRSEMESELSRQGLQLTLKTKVLDQLFNSSSNAEVLSHAEIEKSYFEKVPSGYRFSVIKRILKDIVVFHYLDIVRKQANSNEVPGFSRLSLEQYIQTKKAH